MNDKYFSHSLYTTSNCKSGKLYRYVNLRLNLNLFLFIYVRINLLSRDLELANSISTFCSMYETIIPL